MEGKLYKINNIYTLMVNDKMVASNDEDFQIDYAIKKLSLKNCQAIENGYDLMKLAEENSHKYYDVKTTDWHCNYNGFFSGFQKALEILGDKKFGEFDIIKSFEYGWNQRHFGKTDEDELREIQKRFIQSLQQTEWDVEVCCQNDCYGDYTTCKKSSFECKICTNTGIPKLDTNGCLILKRK